MAKLPWEDFSHPTQQDALLPGRKTLAVYMLAARIAHGNDKLASAQLAHELLSHGRDKLHRTHVLKLYKQFLNSDRAWVASRRGVHPKTKGLLDQPNIQEEVKVWVRAHATGTKRSGKQAKQAPMTVRAFRSYLNNDLLPRLRKEVGAAPDEPLDAVPANKQKRNPWKVSESTAKRYLHKLGFYVARRKSGVYFDGHERSEVVADRVAYLAEKLEHDKRTIRVMPSVEKQEEWKKLSKNERPIVELVHDECAFNAIDDTPIRWAERGDDKVLRRKSKGAGVMESAFINEIQGGILHSVDGTKRAVAFLEYGNGEWWNSDKMVAHLKEVIDLAEHVFPWAQFVFRFDHSSNHTAMAEDALNARRMNKGPGGKSVPKMRRTSFLGEDGNEHIQCMVSEDGKPKGLQKILEERGLIEKDSNSLKKDMVKLMAAQPNFQQQTTILHDVIKARDHICRFYPKFHCELSPIEMFWNRQKAFVRRNCGYNIKSVRWAVRLGLEAVCAEEVRRFFGLCRRYEAAYRMQSQDTASIPGLIRLTGHKYQSHRKVSEAATRGMTCKVNGVDQQVDVGHIQELTRQASCTCSTCR